MNCTFWLMPLLSVSTRRVGAMCQVEPLQPGIDFARDVASAAQFAVKLEQRPDFHAPVEPALFGQVADMRRSGRPTSCSPKTRIVP